MQRKINEHRNLEDNLKKRNHSEDLGIDWRMLLE
jgi:hypothetical protein